MGWGPREGEGHPLETSLLTYKSYRTTFALIGCLYGIYIGHIMEAKKEKVARSLKLEAHLNDRLVALCAHLGVNPNAYLLNEVGKAVSRDELAFVVANNSKDSMNEMVSTVMSIFGELASPEQPEQKEKIIEE